MSDKKFLFEAIDAQRAELCSMADQIFDNPEYEGEEVFASTTRSATWDTAAAIICRARDVWVPQ